MIFKILSECRYMAYVGVAIIALSYSPRMISMVMADEQHDTDFTQSLTGPNDEVLTQCTKPNPVDPNKCDERSPLTLKDVSIFALVTPTEDERNLDPKKKFDRDHLARKIYKNPKITLSPDEVSLIKERIGKVYGATVIGSAWPMLDPSLPK